MKGVHGFQLCPVDVVRNAAGDENVNPTITRFFKLELYEGNVIARGKYGVYLTLFHLEILCKIAQCQVDMLQPSDEAVHISGARGNHKHNRLNRPPDRIDAFRGFTRGV